VPTRTAAGVETVVGVQTTTGPGDFADTLYVAPLLAALRLPYSDAFLSKAMLAAGIAAIIKDRRLTQARAADLLRTTQPKVSELLAGRLEDFSLERLARYLNALDQDVRILVRPRHPDSARARLSVVLGMDMYRRAPGTDVAVFLRDVAERAVRD